MQTAYITAMIVLGMLASVRPAQANAQEACKDLISSLNQYFADTKNWKKDDKNHWYASYRNATTAGGVIIYTGNNLESDLKAHAAIEKVKSTTDEFLQYFCQFELNSRFAHYMGEKRKPTSYISYTTLKK